MREKTTHVFAALSDLETAFNHVKTRSETDHDVSCHVIFLEPPQEDGFLLDWYDQSNDCVWKERPL